MIDNVNKELRQSEIGDLIPSSVMAMTTANPRTGSGGKSDTSGKYIVLEDDAPEEEREALEQLYDDALFRQAVEVPIVDSLSNWRDVTDQTLKKADTEYLVKETIVDAFISARKFGTALIVPVLLDPDEKLIPFSKRLDAVDGAKIFRLVVMDDFKVDEVLEKNILSPYHGRPIKYYLNDKPVHPSRVIPVFANKSGKSLAKGVLDYFNSMKIRAHESDRATEEANIQALGTNIKSLKGQLDAEVVAGNLPPGTDLQELLEARARNFRSNSNNNNALIYDKEEEEVSSITKGNIGDMVKAVEQSLDLLCSAVDIPSSRYLGRSIGGLANSNQSDIKNYIQSLNGMRMLSVEPVVKELDRFIQKLDSGITNLEFEWNPLAIEGYLESEGKEHTPAATDD